MKQELSETVQHLKIRKIRKEDFSQVNKLIEESFDRGDEKVTKRDILFDFMTEEKKIGDGYYYWVGTLKERVVGIIGIGENHSPVFDLSWFAVKPKLQGQGIGKKLLQFVCRKAKAAGAKQLCVQQGMLPMFRKAHGLYEHFGFREKFRLKDYWAKNDDLVVACIDLD